jgi:hypothetical protein
MVGAIQTVMMLITTMILGVFALIMFEGAKTR